MHSRFLVLLLVLVSSARADERVAFFEKKIRPVLVQHCYSCHSAEAQAKKKLRGGLLVDTKAGLLTGGDSGPALVPGKPADSLLLKSMRYEGDLKMPPRGKLPPAVLADFEQWIRQGAHDPRTAAATVKARGLSLEEGRAFWSYRPLQAAPPPLASRSASGFIDAFIQGNLARHGLKPAPEADRAVLLRRLSYDLIGLPPTPEEVDAFVADTRPDAYERQVERLLASPLFGQRWGRHWLDVARFAESLTLRGFVLHEAWRYRDLVIDRFNQDAPFDQFLREQVAGDLLPASTLQQRREQRIATTFLALGNTNLEEQDKAQLRMDVVDEQLETIGKAVLAQTLGCARCHDHKFDPIPTKDYYALAGILRNTRTLTHANVSMWLDIPLPADPATEKAIQAHEAAVAALQKKIAALKGKSPPGKPRGVVTLASLPGIVVDDTKARKVGTWKESRYSGQYVGDGYVHDENADKGERTITFQPAIPKTGKYEVRLAYVPGSNRAPKVPVTIFSADGEKTVSIDQRRAPDIDGHFVSLGQHTFEKSGQGFVLIANEGTTGHVIADAVVFIPVEQLATLAKKVATPQGADLGPLEAELKKLQAAAPRREKALSVEEEKVIEDARVNIRGLVHNLGDRAPRGFLQVAHQGPAPTMPSTQSGRRELADWLASSSNPLTPRVFVNRAWHWLLGEGLVRTTDNFGTTGEKPNHPELLDALATRFLDDGWSIKRLVRRIVLSHTYRQASTGSTEGRRLDPENRWLAQANRRRLQAEAIRDTLLHVSGELTLDQGGPTYRPALATDYGYKHLDTRRSVYAPVFRNALPELFEVFDFADPSVTTGRRNVSTVVPQALFLMNHPFVLERAARAGQQFASQPGPLADRVDRAYRLALGRSPTAAERRLVMDYLGQATTPDAGWSQVFQVLFASLDFRHVE
ncbi:MAG: DUF1553 domain-containing protein [Gemmataceae bacterium]